MSYGETLYTLTNLKVAAWDLAASSYGTPVALVEGQTLTFEAQGDTDERKAYGRMRGLLSVPTHVTGTFSSARLESDVMAIVLGITVTESGSGSGASKRIAYPTGGRGLPYFGIVGQYASEDGGEVAMGIPLFMLDPAYSLSSTQNEFVIHEMSGRGIANSASSSYPENIPIIDQYASAQTINDFDAFFGI